MNREQQVEKLARKLALDELNANRIRQGMKPLSHVSKLWFDVNGYHYTQKADELLKVIGL